MTVEEQQKASELVEKLVEMREDDEDEAEEEEDEDDEEEEEELVDPLVTLREQCNSRTTAKALQAEYDRCSERVNSRNETEETCTQELFDMLHHRDECVAQQLHRFLKHN